MGNRVAELSTPGCKDVIGYAVYQSTAMVNFTPIFYNQLAAELFALALHDIKPRWDEASVSRLTYEVNILITDRFGETPENHQDYDEFLADTDRHQDLLNCLRNQIRRKTVLA